MAKSIAVLLLAAGGAGPWLTAVPAVLAQEATTGGPMTDVATHGALPDDAGDDTAALQAAARASGEPGGGSLTFHPGRYHLRPGGDPRDGAAGLFFQDRDGLVLDGQGAVILTEGLCSAFKFKRCRNVVIRNLVVDSDRPAFSQGTIVGVEGRSFDVKVEDRFPVSGGERVDSFLELDPALRRPQRGGLDVYYDFPPATLVAPQVLRLAAKWEVGAKVGQYVVLRHQTYVYNAFTFEDCKDVTIEGVTIHTTPGMGVVGAYSENIRIKGLSVVPRPDSGRLVSATADATHFNSCSGAIEITDSAFVGMGDDAVNIHGSYLGVKEIRGDGSVRAAPSRGMSWTPPREGDRVEVSRGTTLLPYAELTVARVRPDWEAKCHDVEFVEKLPADLAVGDVFTSVNRVPNVRIARCRVENNRARGFLIQVRGAVVEDNVFRGCSGPAIYVTCDADFWYESLGARDVVVRGNSIEDVNYGAGRGDGAISVFAHVAKATHAPPGVHRGIAIEDNEIAGSGQSAVFVGSTDGASIRGNRIRGWGSDPKAKDPAGVALVNSRNVVLENNRFPAAGGPEVGPAVQASGSEAVTVDGKPLDAAPAAVPAR